ARARGRSAGAGRPQQAPAQGSCPQPLRGRGWIAPRSAVDRDARSIGGLAPEHGRGLLPRVEAGGLRRARGVSATGRIQRVTQPLIYIASILSCPTARADAGISWEPAPEIEAGARR